MAPTIRQSGKYKCKSEHMGKFGNKYLRTAIWLSAISCTNHNKELIEYFYKKHAIEKKPMMQHHFISLVNIS